MNHPYRKRGCFFLTFLTLALYCNPRDQPWTSEHHNGLHFLKLKVLVSAPHGNGDVTVHHTQVPKKSTLRVLAHLHTSLLKWERVESLLRTLYEWRESKGQPAPRVTPEETTPQFHSDALGLFSFHSVCASVLWEQWFGRKHEWLLSERGELVRVPYESVCVCACPRVCVISSWVAGCRQPGRDKLGWMEGARRACVRVRVCVCATSACMCVCACREITSQRTWKCVFSCLPARDSKEISRQPNIPLVFSQRKQEVEYQPLRPDATGSGLEWATLPRLTRRGTRTHSAETQPVAPHAHTAGADSFLID